MSELKLTERISERLKASVRDTPRKSLAKSLEEGLLSAFQEAGMQKDDTLPSNATLSKLIGISHITLRKALGSLEENGVVRQVHGKGTYLNQDFSSNKKLSGTVAVFLPHLDDLYAYTIDAIGKVLTQAGVNMRIESLSWHSSSSAEWDSLPEFKIDDLIGIIRSPSIYPPALIREVEFYREINAESVPVVFIDRPLKIKGISSVGFDDIHGIEKIFDYIWNLNYRNIYFVYPDMMNQNMRNAERIEGFRQAADKHNYNYDEKFIAAKMLGEDFQEEVLKHILKESSGDIAFLCSNDGIAKIMDQSIAKLNIKDRKIQITGFDHSEATIRDEHQYPSALRSRTLLGKLAAELLVEQMMRSDKKENYGKNILLDPKLVY